MEIGLGLIWYAVFIVSVTFHEAAHGLAALKLGDPTAHNAGLVTLDPLAHMQRSPIGMIVIPIVSFLVGGWMMGWASTPYDPYWAQRNRRHAAFMALAGPAANLALVLLAALVIRAGIAIGTFTAPETANLEQITVARTPGLARGAAVLVSVLLSLNLLLLVFNLLPLPPLDGSEIVTLFLSDSAAERYRAVMTQPGFHLIGLVIAWNLMSLLVGPAQTLTLNLLYPGAGYGPV
ncbi:MAG: site-2 protease family protein [Sedimentisphaerales bacterium]|nr:site-2 protease family protein [Sedimentisphaerales bacterium]